MALTAASSPASATWASAIRPSLSTSPIVSSSPSRARSTASTFAPSCAKAMTLARPIPLAAPVTIAALPRIRSMTRPPGRNVTRGRDGVNRGGGRRRRIRAFFLPLRQPAAYLKLKADRAKTRYARPNSWPTAAQSLKTAKFGPLRNLRVRGQSALPRRQHNLHRSLVRPSRRSEGDASSGAALRLLPHAVRSRERGRVRARTSVYPFRNGLCAG